jgi:predicted anti-sigma-YlaC factor YlaD
VRLRHLTDTDLQQLLNRKTAALPRLNQHLAVCSDCRFRLAEYAQAYYLLDQSDQQIADPTLADRVILRITRRERLRAVARYSLYGVAIFATLATAIILTGLDVYTNTLMAAWQILASSLANLRAMAGDTLRSFGRIFTGETILVMAAAGTVLWVSLLDRLAGHLRIAGHRR